VTLKNFWIDEIDHVDTATAIVKNTPVYLINIGILLLYPVIFKAQYAYLLVAVFYSAIAFTVFRPTYESTNINLTITTITLLATLSVIAMMFADFVVNLVALWICLRFRQALVFLMQLGVMEVNETESRFRD